MGGGGRSGTSDKEAYLTWWCGNNIGMLRNYGSRVTLLKDLLASSVSINSCVVM